MISRIHSSHLRAIVNASLIGVLGAAPVWAQGNSQARAVRLSFVEGNVTVHRPDVESWAEAPVNTPLQEGFKLSTGESSFAEVQFENGGTIRLGEFALLDLTTLELAPSGATINHVDLRQGYATFHPLPSRLGESLKVATPNASLAARGGTMFRVDLERSIERVEVFAGSVEVQSDLGDATLDRGAVLVLQPGTPEPTVLSQSITEDDWDHWVEDRENGMTMGAASAPPDIGGGDESGSTYGMSELQQYGNWAYVPGEGYGWSPAGMGMSWAPYTYGWWCWYPIWGYTWIGAEPWGWLPYHNGSWVFIPGRGWVWFPSGPRIKWYPSRVTWYHGSDWVGWIPRSHRPDGVATCEDHCGGGAVSTTAFRQGGMLSSNLMLAVNPTTGNQVRGPGIVPTLAAKLPGPTVSQPAALIPGGRVDGPTGTTARAAAGTGQQNTSAGTYTWTTVGNSQQNGYANSPGNGNPPLPGPQAGPNSPRRPVAPPKWAQPMPNQGQESNGPETETQRPTPNHSGDPFARTAPATPSSNASGGREGGNQSNPSHTTGGGSTPSHSAPAPAPSGGGHSGGGSSPGHH